jgi:general secretion pathway protein L
MNAIRELLFADWSLAFIWTQARASWWRFAAWWLAEFHELWPEFLVTRLFGHGEPVIRLQAVSDGVRFEVSSRRGCVVRSGFIGRSDYSVAALDRHLTDIGRKRRDAMVGIVLPPGSFFQRSFGIPARARERIHTIARQELEHRTPFQAEDIHFGMALDPQQRDAQTLTIHQWIVRRDLVEAATRDLDLALAEISFVAPDAQQNGSLVPAISLRPDADHKASSTRRLILALAAAAGFLTCVDAVAFWWMQERTIIAVEVRAAVERDKALAVRRFEDEIARVQSALNALEERRQLPSTANLWRETSRVLPDNTWVTDWRRRKGSLSIAGFSAKATELVGLFEKSSLFGEASLDAPITFDALTGHEHFSLIIRTRADARLAQR